MPFDLDLPRLLEFAQHHTLMFAALGALLLVFIGNEVYGQLSGGRRLGPLEAVRLINDRNALIVDVRPAADFKKSHLLNAVNLPLAKLGDRLGELGKDTSRPVIVYCALGGSSVEAAGLISKHGFKEVFPMRGGMERWLSSSLPVTAK